MKKRSWLMALCLVLTVAVSISSTLAYLTSQDGDVNVMTVGNVKIQQNEQDRKGNDFQQGQMLLPMVGDTSKKDELGYPAAENYIDKIVTVTNTGSTTAWVRTLIAIPQFEYAEHDGTNASTNVLHWNGYSQGDGKDTGYPAADLLPGTDTRVENNWFWGVEGDKAWPGNGGNWNLVDDVDVNGKKYSVYIITNMAIVEPGETTAPNLIGVYLDSQVDYDHSKGVYTYNGMEITGMDDSVEVLVLSQAVQAGGFDTAWDAFDAAFALGDEPAETVGKWLSDLQAAEVKEVTNNDELKAAIEESSDEEQRIVLAASGEYILPNMANRKVSIIGDRDTVVNVCGVSSSYEGKAGYLDGSDVTFSGVTVLGGTGSYDGLKRGGRVVFDNCKIIGNVNLIADEVEFKNCTFELTNQYEWTYTAGTVLFEDCTFNTEGKALLVYAEKFNHQQVITVKDCTFNATKEAFTNAGDHCAAVEIDGSLPNGGTGSFVVNFEGNNVVGSNFAGLYRIKNGAANVTVNE